MTARLAPLALLALLVGCTVEDPEVTTRCSSLSDCPIGEVCDVRIATCVSERPNWFAGRFTCRVMPPGEQSTEMLGSEVLGNVGGDRWSLPLGALCQHSTVADQLQITSLPLAGSASLNVFLDWSTATRGGTHKIWTARIFSESDTATFWNPDLGLALGYSRSGSVQLWQAAREGAVITGFVDISMFPVSGPTKFGVPCPRGAADCGQPLGDGALCWPDPLGTGRDVCSNSCTSGADCELGDGVCSSGYCSRPCSSNGDCQGDLVCLAGTSGGPSGCF